MTEESKKRMEELAIEESKMLRPQDSPLTMNNRVFCAGYQAGMQDPDAGKDSLAVVNLIHADEKIRELQVAYKGLLEENKRLRELVIYCGDKLYNKAYYALAGEIQDKLNIISSGGE